MKLGFLTACLNEPIESIAAWAAQMGFQALEVSAWPRRTDRDYAGCHFDVARPDAKDKARETKAALDRLGIAVSSLAFYDNNLHPDEARRAEIHKHLRAVIEVAAAIECPLVGTFIGRDPAKNLADNFDEMRKVFDPLLDFAGERGVSIVIENCPMVNWQFEGLIGNIAYSPVTWEQMFEKLPRKNFGLNLDPSHLVWQEIDPVAAARDFKDRIFHVHAKDTEILRRGRERAGNILSHVKGMNWWRYRMPGLGEINWTAFAGALLEGGYNAWLSIEHEDPVWEGSPEKVRTGLRLAQRHLAAVLP